LTKGILERLAEGPVLGDGGYLLELEKRGYVQAGPFTPEVVIEHPDALAQLHSEFLRAGADVLQTMTFYASDDKLATVGLAGRVDDINRTAVQVARQVAAESDALVAGNLSLTWAYLPEDHSSANHVRELFDRQLEKQIEAGPPDFWIG
jgi:betaine-homocysteine S-methyltransferase